MSTWYDRAKASRDKKVFIPKHDSVIIAKNNEVIMEECYNCNKECRVFTVKKDSPNKGRPFYKCEHCPNVFVFIDTPKCCNVYMNSFTAKNGKYAGVEFIKCRICERLERKHV